MSWVAPKERCSESPLPRQSVVIQAARDVENVPWLHQHLLNDLAAHLMVLLHREIRGAYTGHERGIGRASTVDVPQLLALDLDGEDVHDVEMGFVSANFFPGTVSVARGWRAGQPFQAQRHVLDRRIDPVEEIEHQRRALPEEMVDPVLIGPHHLAALAANAGPAVLGRGYDLTVKRQLDRAFLPKGGAVEEVV